MAPPARPSAGALADVLADPARGDAPLLAARLTLVGLLLAPIGVWTLRPSVLVLAAAGLLLPPLARSAALWLALAALAALRVAYDWPLSDNHAYLLAVWCLALGLAHAGVTARAALARNARLLLGLTFALATLQKALLSPDYVDGTFFRWLLAVDPRFEDLGRLLGRDGAALEATRAFLEAPPPGPPEGAGFVETPALRTAATLLTWGTLLLEAVVAAAFLLPSRRVPPPVRDVALALFCAGTFALAPVVGFGWLLLAMGVAQSGGGRARWLHLATFGLLVFHREIPWLRLVLEGP